MDYFYLAILTVITSPLFSAIKKGEFHMRVGSGNTFFYRGKTALLLYAISLPILFVFWAISLSNIFKGGFRLLPFVGVLIWITFWLFLGQKFDKWGRGFTDNTQRHASSRTFILAVLVIIVLVIFGLVQKTFLI